MEVLPQIIRCEKWMDDRGTMAIRYLRVGGGRTFKFVYDKKFELNQTTFH